jgi:hypothetical protein
MLCAILPRCSKKVLVSLFIVYTMLRLEMRAVLDSRSIAFRVASSIGKNRASPRALDLDGLSAFGPFLSGAGFSSETTASDRVSFSSSF